MKGIILSAGNGTRQGVNTLVNSKPLLPCFDKPTIYYPLSDLISAGITEVLVIVSRERLSQYEELFGDGKEFGISISYAIQEEPEGIAQAFIIAEDFIGDDSVALTFGDNIFSGEAFTKTLMDISEPNGATIFAYEVSNPEQFGVVEFDSGGRATSIEEKPSNPKSNFAVVGMYFFDNDVVKIAKTVKKSERGEYEITSVIEDYLNRGALTVIPVDDTVRWFDTGNPEQLFQAASHVREVQRDKGTLVGSPHCAAYRRRFINAYQLLTVATSPGLRKSVYGSTIVEMVCR